MYIVMILTLIIGGAAQAYVTHMLNKYSKVPCAWQLSGSQMAQRMSYDKQIPNVGIRRGGPNQDFFDPRTNSVTLGSEAFDRRSITAVATAVHEMGHAEQFAQGYAFMKFRSALAPIATLCSNGWMLVFFIGIIVNSFNIIEIGIIMFAAVMLFELITLPVEFDASRRGLNYLQACGMNQVELKGARAVLRACALTYVAAALSAALQMAYLLLVSNRD